MQANSERKKPNIVNRTTVLSLILLSFLKTTVFINIYIIIINADNNKAEPTIKQNAIIYDLSIRVITFLSTFSPFSNQTKQIFNPFSTNLLAYCHFYFLYLRFLNLQ